ncbi:25289_t:CDS:2, partial [Racocetra persica]
VRECFKPSYGADGRGNLYKEENIRHFANEVMMGTKNEGADLVTADGGFDVRGRERLQEHHLKQLILCQIITMFMTLQKNGDFVLKLFDVFTPFTAGMRNPQIVSFLLDVNKKFNEIKSSSPEGQKDVNEVVEFNEMNQDEDFIDYLKMSNMKIAIKQTEALEELLKYISNPYPFIPEAFFDEELKPPNQEEYRRL